MSNGLFFDDKIKKCTFRAPSPAPGCRKGDFFGSALIKHQSPRTFEPQICPAVNPNSRAEHPPRNTPSHSSPAKPPLRARTPHDFARKPHEILAAQKAPLQGSFARTSLHRPNGSRNCRFGFTHLPCASSQSASTKRSRVLLARVSDVGPMLFDEFIPPKWHRVDLRPSNLRFRPFGADAFWRNTRRKYAQNRGVSKIEFGVPVPDYWAAALLQKHLVNPLKSRACPISVSRSRVPCRGDTPTIEFAARHSRKPVFYGLRDSAHPRGLEPPTHGLEGHGSISLKPTGIGHFENPRSPRRGRGEPLVRRKGNIRAMLPNAPMATGWRRIRDDLRHACGRLRAQDIEILASSSGITTMSEEPHLRVGIVPMLTNTNNACVAQSRATQGQGPPRARSGEAYGTRPLKSLAQNSRSMFGAAFSRRWLARFDTKTPKTACKMRSPKPGRWYAVMRCAARRYRPQFWFSHAGEGPAIRVGTSPTTASRSTMSTTRETTWKAGSNYWTSTRLTSPKAWDRRW